ncbi:MAG: DUF1294 domain-containing protein [Ahniella sp.]|nr:DUF1294 domain-containing protein [Ahniella sp.]
MRYEGVIKTWNDERGFGFITSDQLQGDLFVHIKAFGGFRGVLTPNTRVTFLLEDGPQGKRRATQVLLVQSGGSLKLELKGRPARHPDTPNVLPEAKPFRHPKGAPKKGAARWNVGSLLWVPAFMIVYLAVDTLGELPPWTLLAYLIASVVTFAAYALDKASAKIRGSRVPESTLHALAFFGGWPGAILAQELLRHKSVKEEFRMMFWITVVLNISALIWLASSYSPFASRM